MHRDNLIAIVGTITLFTMAYLDAGWRWFWAIAGMMMLTWSLYSAFSGDDSPTPKL